MGEDSSMRLPTALAMRWARFEQVVVVAKLVLGELQLARALHQHLIRAVDQHVVDLRVVHARLNGPQPHHIVHDLTSQRTLFVAIKKQPHFRYGLSHNFTHGALQHAGVHFERTFGVHLLDNIGADTLVRFIRNLVLPAHTHLKSLRSQLQ